MRARSGTSFCVSEASTSPVFTSLIRTIPHPDGSKSRTRRINRIFLDFWTYFLSLQIGHKCHF
jgi:hypothetical protein